MSTIKLYRHALSGHCHRVELLISLLGIEAEIINVDIEGGEHKQPAFLTKNIFGQIPVLTDDDVSVADSNAILIYLAGKYDPRRTWFPLDIKEAAEVQRFLSVAAGSIAYGAAAARLVNVFGASLDHERVKQIADNALTVLNAHLNGRQWLATDYPTIADVANYAYIAHAPEGDISLDPYPNVKKWIGNVEALSGFVPMQKTAVGLAA